MQTIEENNKLIIQSYKLSTIRNDFGIYAQRLIVRIAEKMQYRLEDAKFCYDEFKPFDSRLIWTFKVTDIMDAGSHNYSKVKTELEKVIEAVIHYDNGKSWSKSVVFTDIKYDEGFLTVKINDTVWNLFLEFSKGYKRYALKTALKLKSTYALRLYQLLNENETPITYTIEWLKELFGINHKYKQTNDFIKYVIIPAQKELDETAETSFNYEPITTKQGKGRPQITAIRFTTRQTNNPIDAQIQETEWKRKYTKGLLPEELVLKLIGQFRFEKKGIYANGILFSEALDEMKLPGLLNWLDKKRPMAIRYTNPSGYIINALRGEIEERRNR